MNLLNLIPSTDFVCIWIRAATPIIFASLGAVIRTEAGVVNLELEGIMLISALIGVLGGAFGRSLVQGVIVSILATVAASVVFAYFRLVLKANSMLCGTAVNTMASGLTVLVFQLATGEKGNSSPLKSFAFPDSDIPVIKNIPVIGSVLLGHNSLTYVALVMVAVIWFFLYRTSISLRMRVVGENPDTASSVGQNVVRIQFLATVLCGLMTRPGEVYLSMSYFNMFVRDMTAGYEFISLVACSMGQATPIGVLLSSIISAFFDGFSNTLQVLKIPSGFIQMLPYLVTIAGLMAYSIQKLVAAGRRIGKLKEAQG